MNNDEIRIIKDMEMIGDVIRGLQMLNELLNELFRRGVILEIMFKDNVIQLKSARREYDINLIARKEQEN